MSDTETKLHPPGTRGQHRRRRSYGRNWWLVAAGLAVGVVLVAGVADGNRTASSPRRDPVVGSDLHSLVADPTRPGRLFLGGHDAVAVSDDGGRTWSAVESLSDADATGWAFTGDAIWVSGHPGLSRSGDGGRGFQRFNQGLPHTDVHAFGASGSTLYAASPAVGLFASDDGGATWAVRAEAGASFIGRILTGPGHPGHLVAADARSGLVASTDGGRTWNRLGGPASATWVSRGGEVLFVSGPDGAARTDDGGRTWSEVDLPAGTTLLESTPSDPSVLFAAGVSGGTATVWVSRDGGQRWSRP